MSPVEVVKVVVVMVVLVVSRFEIALLFVIVFLMVVYHY